MEDCIFCKIGGNEVSVPFVYEDESLVAFDDLHPQAPVHVLLIPRGHFTSLNEVAESDAPVLGRILVAARKIAEEKGIAESGWRLVVNTNADAGQSVLHLHFHLLGGREMGWPPG